MYKLSLIRLVFLIWSVLLAASNVVSAEDTQYVVVHIGGRRMRARDNRQPALFTADYGDCLGESAINVTRFDAAYYKDNMTIIFHLAGETALIQEDIMMSIGVYAYGESRFELTFNPCNANIKRYEPLSTAQYTILTKLALALSKLGPQSKPRESFPSARMTSLGSLISH